MNETSALVYRLCNGNNSVSEIRQAVSKKLKQPVIEDFVWLVLDQLKKENLLDNSSEINAKFDRFSRREAIKRVGLASMIALPIISSLIALTAAMAQSATATCGALNQSCTGLGGNRGTCCSGLICCCTNGVCTAPNPLCGLC